MQRLIRNLSSQTDISLRTATRFLSANNRCSPLGKRFQSSEADDKVPVDKPITYTKSKAFSYKASQNFRVSDEELTYPNYTSFIVKSSIIIFLAYFCIFREPNEVDQMLGRDLFEIVPDLEIPMLETEVKRLEAHGVNADQLKQKVEDLKRLSSEKKS